MSAEMSSEFTGHEAVLVDELDMLVSRLERGEQVIEGHRAAGRDTSELEDHWIDLLRQYEALFDARQERAA